MAFKEKSAWVMVIALLITGLGYVYTVSQLSVELGQLAPPLFPLLIGFTVVIVIISIIGHILAALSNPREANAPADERDQRIADKASHWSSYVLAVGVVLGLGLYLVFPSGPVLFYVVFGSLALSTLVEYGLQIYFYRHAV
jgi:uncharacterized membrane protein